MTTVTNAFKNCTSLKKLVVYSKSVDMSSAFPGCSDINLYCYKDSAADKAVAGVSDRTYFGEIYTDPPAAVKASAGDSVTVQAQYISDKTNRLTSSVAATWQVNNGGVWENIDTNVSNTTSSHIGTATLTIPDVTLADNGKQFRLYSTDGGSVSEYSSIVTLQIEYGSPATDFVWEFDDAAKTAKVTGYIGAGGDVIVPLSVTGTGEAYGNEYGEYTLGTAGITYTVIDMAAGSRDAGAFSAENKINAGNTGVGNITGVYLPDTLCGEDASFWFYGCTGLTLVDGLPSTITNLSYTYYGCSSLARAPEFPAAAVDLSYTFGECEQLTEVPEIPDTVTVMEDTFFLCKNLVDAPDIPKNVESMEGCFYGCIRLQEPPVIRSTVLKNMRDAFRECGIRTSPVIPDGVTDLSYTFNSCGDMAAVTPIPASVTDMTQTFGSNYELRGDLVVYAKNPTITTILGIGTMYGDLTLYCYKGTTVDTFGQTDRGIAEIRYFGNVTMEMPEEIQAQYGKPVSVTGAYICDEGSSSASVQAHYEVMLPGGQWESAGGRAGFTEQTEDIDGLHKNAVLNIDAEHIVDGMKVRLVATDGNHTFISHEVTVSLDAVISVVVPTKVMFEIDPNVDGAGYTDAAVGSFSNNGGCDVELSVADISGRNGAPLTAYNKYSREEWKNLGRTETENELGFLFQTEGNMLGYIPGQNLTLDELPQGSGQDISYIIAHGNAWTEPKAFVYDITYSVSAIS